MSLYDPPSFDFSARSDAWLAASFFRRKASRWVWGAASSALANQPFLDRQLSRLFARQSFHWGHGEAFAAAARRERSAEARAEATRVELWRRSVAAGRSDSWTDRRRPDFVARLEWAVSERGPGAWAEPWAGRVALELARELGEGVPGWRVSAAARLLATVEAGSPEVGSLCREELERLAPGWSREGMPAGLSSIQAYGWNMEERRALREWAARTQLAWLEARALGAASAQGAARAGPARRL